MRAALVTTISILLSLSQATSARAETARVGGDFTFKKIGIPQHGTVRKLVQIDPEAVPYFQTPGADPRRPGDPRPAAALNVPDLPPVTGDGMDWYWEAVSPHLGGDPYSRFTDAVTMAGRGGARIAAPRLQTLKAIIERHGVDVLTSTIGTRISPALAVAVIAVESAGKPTAVSHAGAQGLMQLMPATAKRFGVQNSNDPRANIRGGVAYLDWLLKNFDGDPIMALAGYNAGEGAVAKHGGVPPYAETRAYVPKVLAAWSMARALCVTPPELVTDGCVFQGAVMASAQTASN